MRSSRRIVWLARPRTSASWRETGRASVRIPSRTASPTRPGSVASSSAAVAASSSIWARARSSAASTSPGWAFPAAASASRSRARSRASSIHEARR